MDMDLIILFIKILSQMHSDYNINLNSIMSRNGF